MAGSKKRNKASEQKQAANELANVNQQLEDLARFPEENPNPVLRVDRDGSILFANAACSMLDFFKCQPGKLLPCLVFTLKPVLFFTNAHSLFYLADARLFKLMGSKSTPATNYLQKCSRI